jgi:hypothetical protein
VTVRPSTIRVRTCVEASPVCSPASSRAPLRSRGTDAGADRVATPVGHLDATDQLAGSQRVPEGSSPAIGEVKLGPPKHPKLVCDRAPVEVQKPITPPAVHERTAEVRLALLRCADGDWQRPHRSVGVSGYETDDLVATLHSDMDVLVLISRSGGMTAPAGQVVALDRDHKRRRVGPLAAAAGGHLPPPKRVSPAPATIPPMDDPPAVFSRARDRAPFSRARSSRLAPQQQRVTRGIRYRATWSPPFGRTSREYTACRTRRSPGSLDPKLPRVREACELERLADAEQERAGMIRHPRRAGRSALEQQHEVAEPLDNGVIPRFVRYEE